MRFQIRSLNINLHLNKIIIFSIKENILCFQGKSQQNLLFRVYMPSRKFKDLLDQNEDIEKFLFSDQSQHTNTFSLSRNEEFCIRINSRFNNLFI